MRVVRLARLIEHKYGLVSSAAPKPKKLDLKWIKRELEDLVKTYITDPPKAYNIVPLLAQLFKDPDAQALIDNMLDLGTNIAKTSPSLLFHQVNSLLELIDGIQKNRPEVRQRIHGYFRKDTDRETAKNKFETVVFERIANVLRSKADELKEMYGLQDEILGGPIEGQRQELSKQQMWMFIHGNPVAGHYGLDNEDVFAKIYADLELRSKLTTLINASNRPGTPQDSPEIRKEIASIMELYRQKQTNESQFGEESLAPKQTLFENEPEPEHVIEGDPLYADPSVLDPTEITRKQEQVKKEDEEKAKRQKEWETSLISKYNSASLQRLLRKV